MDLIDLIGDSRTDSLPAGFLRSIKIKYKQESSRVFPPGTPYHSTDLTDKAPHLKHGSQRSGSAASNISAPVGCQIARNLIFVQENLGAWSAFSPTPHNILVFGENAAHLHLFTVEIHGSLRWGQLRKDSNYECFKVSQFLLSVSLFIHSKLTATCSWSVCCIFVWLYEIIVLIKIVWNFTMLLILW